MMRTPTLLGLLAATGLWLAASDPSLAAGAKGKTSIGPVAAKAPARQVLPDWKGVWSVQAPVLAGFGYDSVAKKVIEHPPLTPKYQEIFDRRVAAIKAGHPEEDSGASCLPNGMPRMMRDGYPMEFVPTQGVVYTLHEYEQQIRRIYTDGRPHPEDPDPTFSGHAIGHWEGATLVVDTVAIKAGWFDQGGLPHSDQTHVIERIRRVDKATMEDRMTVIDPEVFTAPWTLTKLYKLHPEWSITEYVCEENNRNPVSADGKVGVVQGAAR